MMNKEQAMANVRKVMVEREEKIVKAAEYHIDTVLAMAVKVESEKGETFAKRQVSTCDEQVLDKMVEILTTIYGYKASYEGNWFVVDWAE